MSTWCSVILILILAYLYNYYFTMSSASVRLPLEFIDQKDEKATGCLIFLHGLGKTGEWQRNQFETLMGDNVQFSHIKIVFPSAMYIQSKFRNIDQYSWFDVMTNRNPPPTALLDGKEAENSLKYIEEIIQNIVESGIPRERIILGGVSQGGIMSVLYGYTKNTKIGGILSMSAFFPEQYEKEFRDINYLPELYVANFDRDPVMPWNIAKKSYDFLKAKNVKNKVTLYNSDLHEINEDMLKDAYRWIQDVIQPKN